MKIRNLICSCPVFALLKQSTISLNPSLQPFFLLQFILCNDSAHVLVCIITIFVGIWDKMQFDAFQGISGSQNDRCWFRTGENARRTFSSSESFFFFRRAEARPLLGVAPDQLLADEEVGIADWLLASHSDRS